MAKVWLSIPFIFALTSMKTVHDRAAKRVLEFTEKVIQKKRLRFKAEKRDMLDEKSDDVSDNKHCKMAFLDLMLESGMSDTQLRDETMTIIIGGQETTSTELSFALLMLALHPNIQEKVHEELDAVFGEDSRAAPSMFELNSLEYLERVIKETMRLFPALPAIGKRLQEDIHVGQYEIPAGVDIGIFIYETHRDPATWGPTPHHFNPDHFLPEKCRSRHPYSYFPFSAGLRNCIGQKYALLQMKSVLSTLLRRYTLVPGPGHTCIEDIELVMNTTLKSRKGFEVIFNLRNNNCV
uniref:Cytochrome P450 CYP4FB1 n=1 Tax=Nilaparvata lugens TaxID=108931 RepID=A0A0K0LBC1_NILLU|nr:cytochrome P450 CYP4FB1 [Nilaparvata lugens]